ncbi:MAG: hypothetical protein KIT09_07490 [Bryobacteraceae bacterium]|nr:hypothetical protein [Bryobacteraceae bacterium]
MTAAHTLPILPTPQYIEPLPHTLSVDRGGVLKIVPGPAAAVRGKMELAVTFLQREFAQADPTLKVRITTTADSHDSPAIFLWDHSNGSATLPLNLLDLETLTNPSHYGQGYVITSPDPKSLWIIGATGQGVLFGAMTLLQLIALRPQATDIRAAYIRDYPDFEFREAAHWLLNAEINRWALDRGQGLETFARTCEQKLDQALRFKINMVLADGFGWGLDEARFSGYSMLMRRLNRYARARGIHLVFGGYGAGYGLMYQGLGTGEQERQRKTSHLGRVFENRHRYPDGALYRCMGFLAGYDTHGMDPAVLGTCRSNDEVNRMKADDLRRFVEAVEPGALYIHHEDIANLPLAEKVWPDRCPRCRERWPNEDFVAQDGGAGAYAHGYSTLVNAVNSVKHSVSGYDAARDCQILLISPVYSADDPWMAGRAAWTEESPDSEDWARVLELWQNIAVQLPKAANVQLGFREMFPQKHGGKKWTELLAGAFKRAELPFGLYVYYASGADGLFSDYPLSGAPALNVAFKGARTVYNTSGNFYSAPAELVNAEYSWNARSTGFYHDPITGSDAWITWARYIHHWNTLSEIFGPGKLYARACDLLYGEKAGPVMARYYRESSWLPDIEIKKPDGWNQYTNRFSYLPDTWNRLYAMPLHYAHLTRDSATWDPKGQASASVAGATIAPQELHRRLSRRWSLAAELNAKGAALVREAIAAGPRADAVEDLHFLAAALDAYGPWIGALADFHAGIEAHVGENKERARERFTSARYKLQQGQQWMSRDFVEPVDVVGGELGAVRFYLEKLNRIIEQALGQ